MEKEDQRNFLLAMVLLFAFMFAYQKFFWEPSKKQHETEQAVAAAELQASGTDMSGTSAAAAKVPVAEALLISPRATFDGTSVDGSVRLKGSRIDDLSLKKHFVTVEKKEEIRLLRPEATDFSFFGTYYWAEGNALIAGAGSEWERLNSGALSSSNPLMLRLDTGKNLTIERVITLDDNYMFSFEDTLINTANAPRSLRAIGTIERQGGYKDFLEATDPGSAASGAGGLAHMGIMGVMDGDLRMQKYKAAFKGKDMKGESDDGQFSTNSGGWWGLTDKYWMSALVPDQAQPFTALVNKRQLAAGGALQVRTESAPITVDAGSKVSIKNQLFAGAKRFDVMQEYQNDLGVPRMVDAIDWGWAFFLTKPFFYALEWLRDKVGSFGLAILAFTVLIKLPLVPLYNQSYKSMAKMKKLQEPMKEIRERFKADPQRQQQEVMKLYKQEGANPIGGCLPILMTIPIFFALYKTLYVTLEMRHEPFMFLKDLSAPDPTAIGNLFGLLPWAASDIKAIPVIGIIIGIGILPLLYGITMAAMQTLNPPPADPMQAKMMMMLPIVFMFVFGGFASGLVLYWVWSNLLSFGQQYFIMHRNGVEPEFVKKIRSMLGGKAKDAS